MLSIKKINEALSKIPFGDATKFTDFFKKYDAIVFFDTETTGLSPYKNDSLGQRIQLVEGAALRVEYLVGRPVVTQSFDDFVKIGDNGIIPPEIVRFNEQNYTGINDELLKNKGISEKEMALEFKKIIEGNVLLCAYNAQFDICFINEMFKQTGMKEYLNFKDVIDPMTIFKTLKPFKYYDIKQKVEINGHKLCAATIYYDVDKYVVNSHRAIDDTIALYAVFRKMVESSNDAPKFINKIGYHCKYGLNGKKHPKVDYFPQSYVH